jgi:hypothetical protein
VICLAELGLSGVRIQNEGSLEGSAVQIHAGLFLDVVDPCILHAVFNGKAAGGGVYGHGPWHQPTRGHNWAFSPVVSGFLSVGQDPPPRIAGVNDEAED